MHREGDTLAPPGVVGTGCNGRRKTWALITRGRAMVEHSVSRLRGLARDGAEWREYGLLCEPIVVYEMLRALPA